MKIAYIVQHFPSVSQTFILNQITGLIDRGHDVDIFASTPARDKVVHPDIEKYELIKKTYYRGGYYDFPHNKIVRIIKAFTFFKNHRVRDIQPLFKSLNLFEHGKRAISLSLFYSVAPFLKNYDILHCHFAQNGNFGVLLKKLGVKGKLVTTFHGFDTRLGIKNGLEVYRSLFDTGDLFLAASDYNFKTLINFGVKKEKIIYHPLGIDVRNYPFKWDAHSETNQKQIKLITIARLVPEKGIEYAIRGVKEIVQRHPDMDLEYHIVGSGPLKPELLILIDKLKLQNTVRLLGAYPKDKVIDALMKSDIFLLPSVEESFGMVLLEAQAVGLPVIATSVGGTYGAIINGRSGFLVPPANLEGLVKSLEFLIGQPEVWKKMGNAGRKYVTDNYDIDRINDRLVKIFSKLLIGQL